MTMGTFVQLFLVLPANAAFFVPSFCQLLAIHAWILLQSAAITIAIITSEIFQIASQLEQSFILTVENIISLQTT